MVNGIWSSVARLLGLGRSGASRPRTTTRPTSRILGRGTTRPTPRLLDRPRPTAPRPRPPVPARRAPVAPGDGRTAYEGDFTGRTKIDYDPVADGRPDPGEVVWAWVPFEEDHDRGKDRPVLVIARQRGKLLGLMLTSKDHDRDAVHEARYGRLWMDVGSGGWDRQNRPSEVRLDRVLQLHPDAVRREGAAMDKAVYDEVTTAVRKAKGW